MGKVIGVQIHVVIVDRYDGIGIGIGMVPDVIDEREDEPSTHLGITGRIRLIPQGEKYCGGTGARCLLCATATFAER